MKTAIMEEYKALREEILAIYVRRTTLLSVATTLFAGLQTAAMLAMAPELSVLGTLILVAFWSDDVRVLSANAKIGAYIRWVIEPRVAGLQWESILMKLDDPHKGTPGLWARLGLLLSRYPMTVSIGVVLSIFSVCIAPGMSFARTLFVGLGIAAAIVLAVVTFLRSTDWGQFHRGWDKKFMDESTMIDAEVRKPKQRIGTDEE